MSRERHTRPKGKRVRGPALRAVPAICGTSTHATEQYNTAGEEKREREEETEEEERDKIG